MDKADIAQHITHAALDINTAFDDLYASTKDAQNADEHATKCKIDYQLASDSVRLQYADDPKALGSNEATRDATIQSKCMVDYTAMQQANLRHRNTQNQVALDAIRLDQAKRGLAAAIAMASLAGE